MEQEKCLPELMAEKDSLDPSFVHAMRLLAEGKKTLLASPSVLVGFSIASLLLCCAVAKHRLLLLLPLTYREP